MNILWLLISKITHTHFTPFTSVKSSFYEFNSIDRKQIKCSNYRKNECHSTSTGVASKHLIIAYWQHLIKQQVCGQSLLIGDLQSAMAMAIETASIRLRTCKMVAEIFYLHRLPNECLPQSESK